MMVHIPNHEDQEMIRRADRVKMIAERMSSPSRMEGRDIIQQMDWAIAAAEQIIAAAEAIKAVNPGK